MKMIKYLLAAPALTLILVSASFAQQTNSSTTQKPEPEGVTHTSFKNRVFEIKYRDPATLSNVLSPKTRTLKALSFKLSNAN